MTPQSILGLAGGVLGVLGLVTAALVIVRSTVARTTIETLERNVAALDDERQILERRVTALEAENSALKQRVEGLAHDKEELFGQLKSLPAFAEMAQTMTEILGELQRLTRALEVDRGR